MCVAYSVLVIGKLIFSLNAFHKPFTNGLLVIEALVSALVIFSVMQNHLLDRLNNLHVCQVLPQHSCGDTCYIWTWCATTNQYVDNSEPNWKRKEWGEIGLGTRHRAMCYTWSYIREIVIISADTPLSIDYNLCHRWPLAFWFLVNIFWISFLHHCSTLNWCSFL